MKRYSNFLLLSELYQAYNLVNRYLEQSVAQVPDPLFDEATFNAARFLQNNLPKTHNPPGLSKVHVFYALASLGFKFENYKTSRYGYEQL